MDFSDGPEEAAFRKEVRKFIEAEAPKPKKGESATEALMSNWQANQEWFKQAGQEGLDRPGVAEGVRRRQHVHDASSSSSTRRWRSTRRRARCT